MTLMSQLLQLDLNHFWLWVRRGVFLCIQCMSAVHTLFVCHNAYSLIQWIGMQCSVRIPGSGCKGPAVCESPWVAVLIQAQPTQLALFIQNTVCILSVCPMDNSLASQEDASEVPLLTNSFGYSRRIIFQVITRDYSVVLIDWLLMRLSAAPVLQWSLKFFSRFDDDSHSKGFFF